MLFRSYFEQNISNTNTIYIYSHTPNSALQTTTSYQSKMMITTSVFATTSSTIYVNDSQTTAASGTVANNPILGLTIGNYYNGNNPFLGKIAYLAIYSGIHSLSQRKKIMDKLSVKYGIRILTQPVVEYNGDLGITLNGSTVAAWADQSETNDTNKNATQATAAYQPTYTANDTDFNGHGSLTYGPSKRLQTGTFVTSIPHPFELYLVMKQQANSVDQAIIDRASGTNQVGVWVGPTNKIYIYSGAAGSIEAAVATPTGCVIVGGTYNGTSSKLYINSATTFYAGTLTTNPMLGLTIGEDTFLGKIAYMVVYSGVHTIEQRKMIMNELSIKYNIALT